MDIRQWLETLQLKRITGARLNEYADKFRDHVFDDEQELVDLNWTKKDLAELGIRIGHRQHLLDAIQALQRAAQATAAPPAPVPVPSEEADARRDLIIRLVPVAISVGFVGHLTQMSWLNAQMAWPGKPVALFPEYKQWEEFFRLAAAMFVVVSGWEWYWRDVRRRPLNRVLRFYVDVAIIAFSMLFLYSSGNERMWFLSLMFMFFLYVVWDISCIFEFPTQYLPAAEIGNKWKMVPRTYTRGLRHEGLDHGPIINAMWFGYFLLVAGIAVLLPHVAPADMFPATGQAFLTVLAVFAGAFLVRWEGGILFPGGQPGYEPTKGFTTRTRFRWLLGLLAAYAASSWVLYMLFGYSPIG
jgi:hypothetical protein